MAASEHLSSNQLKTYWDKTGQGMLFSPKVGTGMHDDPISKNRRAELVSKLVNSDYYTSAWHPKAVAKSHDLLFKSRIPLQHLSDVVHSGTKFEIQNVRDASSFDEYNNKIIMSSLTHANPDWLNSRTYAHSLGISADDIAEHALVHEFGHAYHNTRIPFMNDDTLGNNYTTANFDNHSMTIYPYLEGVADGYTRRHMSKQFYPERAHIEYSGQIDDWEEHDMSDSAQTARTLYRNTRDYVHNTGDVPFISAGGAAVSDELNKHRPMPYDVPRPETEHPKLPGVDW